MSLFDYNLAFCTTCIQMTNHHDGQCMKCVKSNVDKIAEEMSEAFITEIRRQFAETEAKFNTKKKTDNTKQP